MFAFITPAPLHLPNTLLTAQCSPTRHPERHAYPFQYRRIPTWKAVASQNPTGSSVQSLPFHATEEEKIRNASGIRMSKIVCTIGPKTSDVESIEQLAKLGMDIVRLNMSHGSHEWHEKVIQNVRQINAKGYYNLGILLDTKGPEVRSGDLKVPLHVSRSDKFTWTIRKQPETFGKNTVDVSYDGFVNDINVGDTLLVDGGMCSFLVTEITATDVITECIDGGTITSRRHLNVRGKSASLPAITEKDWQDIEFGLRMNVDFYALSFVKHEADVSALIKYLREKGSRALVLSKIESAEAIKHLRPILEASDGAMVARGDLGAEIPLEEVPLIQDEVVMINRELRKPTIVATHMLESMITYPTPTRAEVADITEAVRQGADATMLSGETANGSFPLKALEVMAIVAESVIAHDSAMAETNLFSPIANARQGAEEDKRIDLAYTAGSLASRLKVSTIVVFTKLGTYAKLISATRPRCQIVALASDEDLVRRLNLYWGVKSFQMDLSNHDEDSISRAIDLLVNKGLVCRGQNIVFLTDMLGKIHDAVDSIQIRRVH